MSRVIIPGGLSDKQTPGRCPDSGIGTGKPASTRKRGLGAMLLPRGCELSDGKDSIRLNTVITGTQSRPLELRRLPPAGPSCGGARVPPEQCPPGTLQGPGTVASLGNSAQYDPRPFLGLVQGSAHPWEGAAARLNRGRSEGGLGSAALEAP